MKRKLMKYIYWIKVNRRDFILSISGIEYIFSGIWSYFVGNIKLWSKALSVAAVFDLVLAYK